MSNVVINGRTAVHAGSGGVFMAPDVCQVPPLCIPASFTNTALSKDATGTASSVIINGQPACHLSSTFMVSNGDEGGSCGGIISGTIKGQAQFITSSPNVFIEGQPAVRQADQMVSNNANTPPAPLQQPGAGLPSDLSVGETEEEEIAPGDYAVGIRVKGDPVYFPGAVTITPEHGE